ncbi:MAG TPA: prepilin-type N-terminal cleavage/methylation domain-containing protein [Candidatus Acidoferrum sp.]|jgi:prepilin-type N-terminal cleavage/methylation domain-containing protein
MKKQKGFSLIELLIVVAIILIIAAIAIPSLLKSRIAANEASAVGSVRSINTSQVTYSNTCQFYAAKLSDLNTGGPCAAGANTIDAVLGAGLKSGYQMTSISPGTTAAGTNTTTFDVNADPITQGVSGQRHFFSNESLVIRYDPAVAATNASQPL